MDDTHAVAAIRYVERNPVRAGIVDRADQFCWSSAGAHCGKTVSPVLAPCPLVSEPAVWASFLEVPDLSPQALELEDNTRTGRPLGHASFVDRLEQELCRPLRPGRRGPKPRAVVEASGEVAAA
jgi:putative transposase